MLISQRHTVLPTVRWMNTLLFSKGFIMKTCLKLRLLSFLVLLFYTTLSVSGKTSPETLARYRKFINQHVDAKMAANNCDREVNRRQIFDINTGACKDTNTFILATTNHIKPICDKAGKPYPGERNLRISNQPFPVVNCEAKRKGKRVPNCVYNGKAATVYIVISCEEGYPVHYDHGRKWMIWLLL